MTVVGAVFRPQFPPDRLGAVARAADEAGLAELWLWEDCFFEGGIATAAAALARTERLRVAVGVLPVPLRNPALTAMETAALERMFPGRFVLGVGHGVQDWMGQVGARVDSPLTLLREHLDALRALLRGERVTSAGRYVRLTDVGLERPPAVPPAVLAAATGPRTVHLAGEAADGTVLTSQSTPADVRRARGLIDEGRAAAGRTDAHRLVVYLKTTTGPGAAERLAAEVARTGHDPAAGVAGPPAAIAAAVDELAAAGADAVVLEPTGDEPDPEGFVRVAAQEVAPLVAR